jgi:pyruvate/2-oxoglutarate dehydrogenase complex dihydrolipoamide acyltransferase (E2) component
MSKYFESPKSQYNHVDEFKHKAMHTMNKLWGQSRKFEVVDFGERIGEKGDEKDVVFYTATGYYSGEKLPPEQKPGEPMTEEQIAAQAAARAKQQLSDETGATDSAIKLALDKGVDIKLVKPVKEGARVGYQDVQKYIKENKPKAP